MKAIHKKPGQKPEIIEIDNKLDALREAVGGHIEAVTDRLVSGPIAILCDEEGRLKGKPHNTVVGSVDFVGDILIVGVKDDDFTDLKEEQANFLIDELSGNF